MQRSRIAELASQARIFSGLAAISFLLPLSPALAESYRIAPSAESLVKFESKAPMESFDGKTSAVLGRIEVDPEALGDSLAIEVEVDMATLDTGVKLRNQHMRENHLHTEKFPKSSFRGARLIKGSGVRLADELEHEVVLEGTLDLHGVKKTIQVPAKIRRETLASAESPGTASNTSSGGVGTEAASTAVLHLSATFSVTLSEFEIPRPQMLFMKLGETQRVVVTLRAAQEAVEARSP